jgi:hypothetical protein
MRPDAGHATPPSRPLNGQQIAVIRNEWATQILESVARAAKMKKPRPEGTGAKLQGDECVDQPLMPALVAQ